MTTICPFPSSEFSLLSQLNSVGSAAVILWPVEDCPDFRVRQFQICHSELWERKSCFSFLPPFLQRNWDCCLCYWRPGRLNRERHKPEKLSSWFNLWESLVIVLSSSSVLKSSGKKKKNTQTNKKPAFKNICCLSLAGIGAQTQHLYYSEKNEKKTVFCVLKGLFFCF